MRLLVFTIIAGFGLYALTSGQGKRASPPNLPSAQPASVPVPDGDSPEEMVRIQGKWYKYRADNRYMIDGVPTLHIAKKPIHEKTPELQPSTPQSQRPDKPEALAKMANENPFAVYTPEGLKTFQEGLKAAQDRAAERKKTLEALTAE